jgi:hypothetical protein
MKRTIEVRSSIRHHLDLADLKLSSGRVEFFRLFAAEKVTDNRRGQTSVSDQTMLNCVTEINELFGKEHW